MGEECLSSNICHLPWMIDNLLYFSEIGDGRKMSICHNLPFVYHEERSVEHELLYTNNTYLHERRTLLQMVKGWETQVRIIALLTI